MLTPLLPAWNGSWNGGAESPSVLDAMVALSCGIGAGSGVEAREHASCKRQIESARHAPRVSGAACYSVRPVPSAPVRVIAAIFRWRVSSAASRLRYL